ncbi:uncharacterized protein LOC142241202 [Haematobia irritans]|uniref:uncharacterized protein LOC142241202 n=1 Tax=Haematobia irritans TaxID=7368 RepID=UPI003F4FDC89
MEIDVNLHKPPNAIELKTISAGSYSITNGQSNSGSNNNNNHSFNNNHQQQQARLPRSTSPPPPASGLTPGCCGILSRLLCSSNSRGKTATSSGDYNTPTYNGYTAASLYGSSGTTPQHHPLYMNLLKKGQQHRRTPQEIYFESRGKSCKKLLKFNGNSNKILLYPEEGWARTASSSYWTITPCWWQPNRCRIEEFAGTQRQVTKAKMVPLEQKGSLLIVGHFRSKDSSSSTGPLSTASTTSTTSASSPSSSAAAAAAAAAGSKDNDEFKLYLSSNISMEDYNMGYCLTGFVERRCQQTNTFQMTHFAVIKRQWPSLTHTQQPTSKASRVFSSSGFSSSGSGGSKRRDTSAKPT